MEQPFYSSEIRWFASESTFFKQIYEQLPGRGIKESKRIDYYLNAHLVNTGIKIRAGKHEIKVKCAPDEKHPLGIIEHWCKWSTTEPRNILNTIDSSLQKEWIAVEKTRYKKMFAINPQSGSISAQTGFIEDGGGFELTELKIEGAPSDIYTFGLEAFGTQRSCRQNILDLLDFVKLPQKDFEAYINMGYPEYLASID